MELLLLRHGKAKKSTALPDRERPLKQRGKRHAQRLGAWLQEQGIVPDLILCSPAERARTTAEKCIKAMGLPVTTIALDETLYRAEPDGLLTLALQQPPQKRVMLVGHNPALEGLVRQLIPVAQWPRQPLLLPPGTLVRISLFDHRPPAHNVRGRLLDWIQPDQLPETFPVSVDGRIEQRQRPAYYYRQSAVIPYRVVDGKLQLLMITSSSGRWWGIPKGIVEPGLSEQESAAREALEEAGVIGRVDPSPVGEYRHEKWGATCQVRVYAMAVQQLQERAVWQENYRRRRWCTLETALQGLKSPELARLIRIFGNAMQERH